MSHALVIEVGGITAGIVVGRPGDFRFFSSDPAFDLLDGMSFASAEKATQAIAARQTGRRPRRAA